MSESHVDRTYRRRLAGEPLTPEEERHVRTCAACQRVTADADALDGRLREAVRGLASTPIPDQVLDVEPIPATTMERLARGGIMVGAIAAAAMVVAVGLSLGAVRLPGIGDAPPSESPSIAALPSSTPAASPAPSGQPSPAPSPAPPTDAHLVGPSEVCADGIAGFTIVLPEQVYANRRGGDEPACRQLGSVRPVDGRQNLDPMVFIAVSPSPPAFDPSTIEAEEHRTSDAGIDAVRYEISSPEDGAVAASDEVTYVVALPAGEFVTATTDARSPEWVDRLDAAMRGFDLIQPIAVAPAAVEAADDLFTDRDVCQDPQRGLSVVFPDAWWTNTAVDDLPACSWFAPTSFDFTSSDLVPEGVEITLDIVDGTPIDTNGDVGGWETLTLLGHPATRLVTTVGDVRSYEYLVPLGGAGEIGPTLIGRTVADPADQDLAMAVLDRLMTRVSFAPPPSGASSPNPPISAPALTGEATDQNLRLELRLDQGRYRAGQPIVVDATLTYLGDEPSVTLWGSGSGLLGMVVRQLDGDFVQGGAMTTDCVPYELSRGEPMVIPFAKSGSFTQDDPLLELYEAYFRDPLLRLPPGQWEVSAAGSFTLGGDDCGAGPPAALRVTLEFSVEP